MAPDDFYNMDVDDYLVLRRGYYEKLLYEQHVVRRSTMIIASSIAGSKRIKPDKLWPMPDSKKQVEMVNYGGITMSKKMAEKLARMKGKKNG